MKKYLLAFSVVVLVFILSALCFVYYINIYVQKNKPDKYSINNVTISENRNEKYVYPIRPGTTDWEKLNSKQEMVSKTQIPRDILHSLSTKALTETVLDYPLLEDYIAYSNPPKVGPQKRFELLAEEFNGYKELINRGDGILELKKIYINKNLLSHDDIWKQINDPNCDCESINYINNIEYLIAQNDFLKRATTEELKLILKHAQTIMNKKLNSEDYGITGANSTAFLLSRILSRTSSTCISLLQDKDVAYLIEKGEYIGIYGEKIFSSFTECEIS